MKWFLLSRAGLVKNRSVLWVYSLALCMCFASSDSTNHGSKIFWKKKNYSKFQKQDVNFPYSGQLFTQHVPCICKYLCSLYAGFPGGSVAKDPPANAGDMGSIPAWGRSPGERNGNPLQYSCLENPMKEKPGRSP